jgi:GTP-binding protein
MPQTKFVVGKALKVGLKPIVAINKVDRSDARAEEVVDEVFDLFTSLDATDEQLDFPILYGSGRAGWMNTELDGDQSEGLEPMFKLIESHVQEPVVEEGPFSMIGTILEANPFLGRIITGRINSGSIKPNQAVKVLHADGKTLETGRISKILAFRGMERVTLDEAHAGDIVAIAGLSKGTVADTFCDPSINTPMVAQPIDPPTVTMSFIVNDSPFAGTEGDKVTSRVIRDRLYKEAEGNVALKIEEAEDKDSFYVSGRGELQLAVLIETMRREGFEIAVSRPRVVLKDVDGVKYEPIEEVVIDVDEEYSGVVVQKMAERKGDMIELRSSGGTRQRLVFQAPTRGLIGYQSELMTDTRGTAIMNRLFHDYEPFKGAIGGRNNGVLISQEQGVSVAYAMFNLEDRGHFIIGIGERVYAGMIVGIHNRPNDLEINILKGKKLTNMRASGKDEAVKITTPIKMTLEKSLSWIQDDELMEVTPKNIRLRKIHLDPHERKRFDRSRPA